MKLCRTYRGVKIFRVREEIPGSNLKERKDERLVPCKPEFYPPTSQYHNSFPYDTKEECIEAIDWVYNRCKEVGGEVGTTNFAAVLNGEPS